MYFVFAQLLSKWIVKFGFWRSIIVLKKAKNIQWFLLMHLLTPNLPLNFYRFDALHLLIFYNHLTFFGYSQFHVLICCSLVTVHSRLQSSLLYLSNECKDLSTRLVSFYFILICICRWYHHWTGIVFVMIRRLI